MSCNTNNNNGRKVIKQILQDIFDSLYYMLKKKIINIKTGLKTSLCRLLNQENCYSITIFFPNHSIMISSSSYFLFYFTDKHTKSRKFVDQQESFKGDNKTL